MAPILAEVIAVRNGSTAPALRSAQGPIGRPDNERVALIKDYAGFPTMAFGSFSVVESTCSLKHFTGLQ